MSDAHFSNGKGRKLKLKYNRGNVICTKDMHKYYKAILDGKLTVLDEYQNISTAFYRKVMDRILTEGFIWDLPFNMGAVGIKEFPFKKKVLDDGELNVKALKKNWAETLKLWKELYPEIEKKIDYKKIKNKPIVYYDCDMRYKFTWSKKKVNYNAFTYFKLMPPDKYKRKIAKYLLDTNYKLKYYDF